MMIPHRNTLTAPAGSVQRNIFHGKLEYSLLLDFLAEHEQGIFGQDSMELRWGTLTKLRGKKSWRDQKGQDENL